MTKLTEYWEDHKEEISEYFRSKPSFVTWAARNFKPKEKITMKKIIKLGKKRKFYRTKQKWTQKKK